MNARTEAHSGVNPTAAAIVAKRVVRPDTESRAAAHEFLTELIGSPPDAVLWDGTHHLQGHTYFCGNELIVIAPRDQAHSTVVLTAQDWEALRRASSSDRPALLASCAIADHTELVGRLGVNDAPTTLPCAA